MTRPLLLAAGLLFAGCHSSTPARAPAPVIAAPAARPHHPPREDLIGSTPPPLAEFISTGRPCTKPMQDPAPSRPERVPLERRRLLVTNGPAGCASQPRPIR